eukprot:SAG11_NODE_19868_length_457_cov_1.005587_1_plen_87_part_10
MLAIGCMIRTPEHGICGAGYHSHELGCVHEQGLQHAELGAHAAPGETAQVGILPEVSMKYVMIQCPHCARSEQRCAPADKVHECAVA